MRAIKLDPALFQPGKDSSDDALPADAMDDTQTRILNAALAVLSEFGFRKSSMEDVARAAGVSRVTLYRRFTDKDALVHEVILREARRSLTGIIREMASEKSPEERFVRGFVATVMVARRHPLFRKLIEGETEIILPRYAAVTASQTIDLGRTYMSAIITHLQGLGQYTGLDPEYLSEMLIRLWHSLVLVPSAKIASDSEKSLTKFARSFLYPLLAQSPS
jgi:TetR/AcrR family transcriptional regulator, repressor for uid operon